ncbi:MAG TPA: GNAT family N-acetyltransferase [Candidatus Eisenbacteria bacterium]
MSKERTKLPWTAEPYRPAERQAILDLIRSYYGPIETADGDFFDWQYFANPSGPVVLWLAHDPAGAIVGQHVLLPMKLLVDGAPSTGCLSFNALVDPRYHGQGIWTGLGRKAHDEAASRGLSLAYGIPNPNSNRPMVKDLGYHRPFDVPVLVKALDLGAAARHVLGGWKGSVGGFGGSLAGPLLFPRRKPRPGGAAVTQPSRFDAAYDRLAERSGRRYRILLHRDAAHLNWRYVDCPTRTTHRWEVRSGGESLGYAVLRVTDFRGIKLGVLLDFLVDDSTEAKAAGLEILAHAEEAAREAGCPLLLTFCLSHTAEYGLLHRAGWRVGPAALLPQPFPLLVRPLNWPDSAPTVDVVRHWFLTTGDYDVF